MNTKPTQPDAAIDKTLAALRNATPPEGLEARIVQRLEQPAPSTFSWRDLLTGYTLASAWWRGAAAGAAIATLAVAALLLLPHAARTARHTQAVVATPTPASPAAPLKVAQASAAPCPCVHPAILRVTRPASPVILHAIASDQSNAPSHPAPVMPLTAQERALARFAHTADPKAVAALSQENHEQLEAENARFEKFFTPPPPLPQPVIQSNPSAQPAANPAAIPEPTPEVAPQSGTADPNSSAQPALNPVPNPEATPQAAPQSGPPAPHTETAPDVTK